MSHQTVVAAAAHERYEESRFGMRMGPFVAALHLAYALLLAFLGVWPLSAVFAANVLFDLWLWHSANRHPERLQSLFGWAWIVVFAQALLAVWVLGADAGFQFYLLAMIPRCFARSETPLASKLLETTLVIVFFLICDSWLLRYAVPLYPYSEPVLAMLRHINTIGSCVVLAGGAYIQALVIKESREALRHAAGTDALTGLLNRRSFGEIAERELARCRRNGRPLALVLGDIDLFKRINDAHGHAAGDHVLQVVANLLPVALREYDSVARWGGEEFIVLLPDTDLDHALTIAERLRAGIAGSQAQFEGRSIPVTMTLGVARFAADDNWQAIVARADEALYRGKRGGRNRVEVG